MITRAARAAEVPRLRDIDWDAGQIFRDIGMPEAADFEPPAPDALAARQRARRLGVGGGRAAWPAPPPASAAPAGRGPAAPGTVGRPPGRPPAAAWAGPCST